MKKDQYMLGILSRIYLENSEEFVLDRTKLLEQLRTVKNGARNKTVRGLSL